MPGEKDVQKITGMTPDLKKKLIPPLTSLILGALFVVLLLVLAGKYRIKAEEHLNSGPTSFHYYVDLNHDGVTERVDFLKDLIIRDQVGMIVYTPEDQIIDQWNFDGAWGRMDHPFIGDINGDNQDEIILFSLNNDSILMHCVDPLHGKILFRDLQIAKVYREKERYDFKVYPGFLYDQDGDGFKEIYFSISCGFTTRSRRYYAYNMVRDTLFASPRACVPAFDPRMWDLDRDGKPEIFGRTFSPGNCDTTASNPIPYSDYYNWLEVFTPDLRFKFPPMRFNKYPSSLYTGVIRGEKEDHLFVFHHYRGREGYPSLMLLLNGDGKILKKRKAENLSSSQYSVITPEGGSDHVFLVGSDGEVFRIDTSLTPKPYYRLPGSYDEVRFWSMDLDGDGVAEYIFKGKTRNDFMVTSHDLRHALRFTVGHGAPDPVFSVMRNGKDPPLLALDGGGYTSFFRYGKTFAYRYWFLFYLVFALFVYLLFYLADKVREYRRLKVADTQRRIYELQLRSFQNQLDPHFTFNAITSLGTLIYTEEKEAAYDYLVRFSGLIRKILESSDKIAHTLGEELDFVKNYLELQKFRMKGDLHFDITVSPGVNMSEMVPRMIIQTHVENALKHGLMHSEKEGRIWIRISCVNHILTIEVEDNGIGREKARELNQRSTHLGLKVTEQFYTLINKYNRQKIEREIIDLYDDEGRPAGTRVVLRIPEGIVYNL